jgi:hypothetical protein
MSRKKGIKIKKIHVTGIRLAVFLILKPICP